MNEIVYLYKEDIVMAHRSGFQQFGGTLYDFCLRIANYETRPDMEDIEKWIQSYTKPYSIYVNGLSD
ncbi:hypothetical protein [Sporosarcina limicola]|uniref:Uncharacterized protein n=1 Tax=Sporosarcina limicola TaxID=34101 RepID=A0A927MQI7_9BACL|nr:hypothetical protein [Sporosarcina limicola]MBE1555521.1 hypothetical protein [Sporosarcina limicola]